MDFKQLRNFDALRQKRKISLRCKELQDDDLDVVIRVLQESTILEEIYLYGNRITLADGKFTDALANNNNLRVLYLHQNQIGPEGAEQLASAITVNKTLRVLRLHNNLLGDGGIQRLASALQSNETLSEVTLLGNQIGDIGAKSIAVTLVHNNSLDSIFLNSNNIGDKGARHIALALSVNQCLRKLLLDENAISDVGGEYLAESLKYNRGITDMALSGNSISAPVQSKIDSLIREPSRARKPLTPSLLMEISEMKGESIEETIAVAAQAQVIALSDTQVIRMHKS